MNKIDFKKEWKEIYSASAKQCAVVTIPRMNFLMIDGKGDPNTTAEFHEAINALFSVAYTIKFMIKKSREIDYGVMPLEGLWWCDNMAEFNVDHKDIWQWTIMIMQPDVVTKEIYQEAAEKVLQEKQLVSINTMRFASFDEGSVAQLLHVGPFSEEGPTIEKLHNFLAANGYTMNGKHHEIYLSDTRRGNPQNWKTIIRMPVFPKSKT